MGFLSRREGLGFLSNIGKRSLASGVGRAQIWHYQADWTCFERDMKDYMKSNKWSCFCSHGGSCSWSCSWSHRGSGEFWAWSQDGQIGLHK